MSENKPLSFKIDVSQQTLDWVTQRVQSARVIPDAVKLPKDREWEDGAPSAVMNELIEYWKNSYDWRKVEEKLNSTYKMFTLDIAEGDEVLQVHFVHHVSKRPGAIPLLFAHGWPGNFTEVEGLLSLTSPKNSNKQAFHIIAPTIPGFVFSSQPQAPEFGIRNIAAVYHKLMLNLGYTKYIAQGGDWGSMIARSIAQNYPESCLAIHVNFLATLPPSPLQRPLPFFWLVTRWFTPDEKKRLGRWKWWMSKESGYFQIQSTKPQTISYGLLDSPIGMLAWIREKLEALVEPGYVWDKEKVITWAMLYLLSNSAWHARIYKTGALQLKEQVLSKSITSSVAFGASCFPYEVAYVPKWWAEKTVADNIIFWKEHDKGGHFPSVEQPKALRSDIRAFIALLPESTKRTLRGDLHLEPATFM